MNHKRKGPKSTREGCLMCKPHKDQRRKDCLGDQTLQERRARVAAAAAIFEWSSDIHHAWWARLRMHRPPQFKRVIAPRREAPEPGFGILAHALARARP